MAAFTVEFGKEYDIKKCGWGRERIRCSELEDNGFSYRIHSETLQDGVWSEFDLLSPKSNIDNVTANGFDIVHKGLFSFPCIKEVV